MGKVTFVVVFEDGKEPAVNGHTEILGGRLTSILWADYRDDFFNSEQVDAVREALKWDNNGDDDDEKHDEIISKMELLTL